MSSGTSDAGSPPARTPMGSGSGDAGTKADAGTRADAGTKADAGSGATPDAGTVVKRNLQLTFDDGPEPVKSALDPILKEVKARGVVAAFFVLGAEVATSRASVVAIRDAGHVLGNHSWNHLEPRAEDYSDDAIYDQFARTHAEVKKAGVTMEYWRAPRLAQSRRIGNILMAPKPPKKPLYVKGHCDVQADSDDSQGASSAEAMLRAIQRDFNDPRIAPLRQHGARVWRLLFHVKPTTASALATVLDELQAQGGTLVDFLQDS